MKVALFVPCYVDQFYPGVAVATLRLLQKSGVEVVVPLKQTCCGQPMANSGFEHLCEGASENFRRNFSGFDYVVSPSGSCVLHVKEHVLHQHHGITNSQQVMELTEFLTDVIGTTNLKARFPFKVGLHESCHGQRGLHLSQMSTCGTILRSAAAGSHCLGCVQRLWRQDDSPAVCPSAQLRAPRRGFPSDAAMSEGARARAPRALRPRACQAGPVVLRGVPR